MNMTMLPAAAQLDCLAAALMFLCSACIIDASALTVSSSDGAASQWRSRSRPRASFAFPFPFLVFCFFFLRLQHASAATRDDVAFSVDLIFFFRFCSFFRNAFRLPLAGFAAFPLVRPLDVKSFFLFNFGGCH